MYLFLFYSLYSEEGISFSHMLYRIIFNSTTLVFVVWGSKVQYRIKVSTEYATGNPPFENDFLNYRLLPP